MSSHQTAANGKKGALAGVLILSVICTASPLLAIIADLSILTPRLSITERAWSFDPAGSLSGAELGKMIEEEIGSGNYQQTTVLLQTCAAGAGLETISEALTGSHNVIAACGAGQSSLTRRRSGEISGFLPAFLDSVLNAPQDPVSSHLENGKNGTDRFPATPEREAEMKEKYERRRKHIIDVVNPEREAEGKEPLAVPPKWDEGGRDEAVQEPEVVASDDNPASKKLAAGNSSNHAIIYRTAGGDLRATQAAKARAAFEKAGFDSIAELTPYDLKVDHPLFEAANGTAVPPAFRDDLATPGNLRRVLQEIKPKMNPDEHLFVLIFAHGSRNECSDQGALPGDVGPRFAQDNARDHVGSHASGSLLGEEVRDSAGQVIVDDYLLTRWAEPALVIQTADETNPSGQPVPVFINGVPVGLMDLEPGGSGYHRFTLSDSTVAELLETTDFTQGFDIEFDFSHPGDSFVLATRANLAELNGGVGYFGISLVYHHNGDNAALQIPPPRRLRWIFDGTAQGGEINVTISGITASCSVTIPTAPGESAATVAANFATALSSDSCLDTQGISATSNGNHVFVTGQKVREEALVIDDPGLLHVAIPTLSGWALALLTLLLLTAGTLLLRWRPAG